MPNSASNRRTGAVLASVLALVLGTSVHAEDKKDRAQEAIAAAEAKIQAAQTAGAGSATPDQVARAREVLADAREELHQGHKTAAIADANHAAALAESSIGETQRQVTASASDAVQQAQAVAADARQQAADANARAASADQAAAASAQQAQAAQASAAISAEAATAASAGPPTQVQTTVTTEEHSASTAPAPHKVTHRVVHHRKAGTHVSKTTTTVTQTQ